MICRNDRAQVLDTSISGHSIFSTARYNIFPAYFDIKTILNVMPNTIPVKQ